MRRTHAEAELPVARLATRSRDGLLFGRFASPCTTPIGSRGYMKYRVLQALSDKAYQVDDT